ncbi:MAG: hypothetical protein ACT4N2_11915 [Hyphomicrobium sp.]
MSRILAVALAAIVAMVVSFSVVKTGAPHVAVSTVEAAAKYKMCKSKLPNGRLKTWRCGTDQACCVNHSMGLYVCGFAGLGCL